MLRVFMVPSVAAVISILILLILSTHHHVVLGVHNDVLAFQYTNSRRSNGNIKLNEIYYSSINNSQLRYSSDEDGIVSTNWLQQQSNTSPPNKQILDNDELQSSDVNTELDDHIGLPTLNDIESEENSDTSVIDDSWTNDTKERRIRRIQSLDKFNSKQKTNTLQSDDRSSKEEDKAPSQQQPMDSNILGLPYNDMSQLQAIQSNAPAILLPSGPGTGKSHVLSLRIAYLLQKYVKRKQQHKSPVNIFDQNEEITPDSMVILSFTNKDANRLKDRALQCLFPTSNVDILTTQFWNNQRVIDTNSTDMMRREISNKLWAGTMHSFSLAILNKYSQNQSSSSKLRVLPAREMRNRVSASLRTLLNEKKSENTRLIRDRHLLALNDVGQSRSILYQNIVRCIELWKEANVPLVPPEIIPLSVIQPTGSAEGGGRSSIEEEDERKENQHREVQIRKSCMELAMRLGIPKSSALLALDIFSEYQSKHAAAGTADPSDLASMAYRLLIDQPETLHSLRSKLKHLIVDEYQDMSVSQHALLRLVVRGDVHEDDGSSSTRASCKKKKAEQRRRRKLPVLLEPSTGDKLTFKTPTTSRSKGLSVPNIFCAGDASQSIYGWRGGAPELTVHGFRRDYPQGVIAPLSTCYRLPNDIVEAAAMLLPQGNMNGSVEFMDESDVSDSYDVSPAAAAKLASSIIERQPSSDDETKRGRNPQQISEDKVRLGNRLLLSKAMQKIDSTVLLHGLWDDREEAKYIASTIRRRSKERRKALINALSDMDEEVQLTPTEKDFLDLTEVAIMARTSNKLHLVKEALTNAGIPFVTSEDIPKKEVESANNWLSQKRSKSVKTLPMKPVIVSTMHRSKGEEFDDVYLAGWTEGEFPHPDAVSSNRVHEERRLAYVALTRARQRVVITHSFMKRVLHYGKNGMKKYVTSQVEPSRFLYELVPSKRIEDGAVEGDEKKDKNEPPWLPSSSDNKGTIWKRSSGIKEYIVGKNVPDFFQKAYQKPNGYVAKRSELRRDSSIQLIPEKRRENPTETPPTSKPKQEVNISQKTPLDIVAEGLRDIVGLRKKGASKKYTPIFKEMLASFFQIRRGKALVFKSDARGKQTQNESVYALIEASSDDLMKKPLGKCTATQLGHYLAYLVLSKKEDEEASNDEVATDDKVGIIDWADLPIKKLKPELKKRGLKVSGKKADLVQRLIYDDQQRRIDNM